LTTWLLFDERCFFHAGPKAWNSLPHAILTFSSVKGKRVCVNTLHRDSFLPLVTFGVSLGQLEFCITVFQKSDAKIQITITTAHLIRIKCPLSGFNCHLSDVNIANFNKIHCTVSEQQLF